MTEPTPAMPLTDPVVSDPGLSDPEAGDEALTGALEAILMVVDEPAPVAALATAVRRPTAEVESRLRELAAEYTGTTGGRPRGFVLREVAGGWRIYSAPSFARVVGDFLLEGQTARLTHAALETLAIIAYQQPVTRGRIAGVRGVNVDGVVRTLLSRGLVEEAGHDPEGGAVLYRTSGYFLERFGLRSLRDLPPLAPYLPDLESLGDVDGPDR